MKLILTLFPCRQQAARRRYGALRFCALIVALGLLSQGTGAQTLATSTMRGQVLDQNGAAIVGAQVVVTNELTGLRRETSTDDGGYYAVANLPLTGKYKLTVSSSGFAVKEVNDIELRAGW